MAKRRPKAKKKNLMAKAKAKLKPAPKTNPKARKTAAKTRKAKASPSKSKHSSHAAILKYLRAPKKESFTLDSPAYRETFTANSHSPLEEEPLDLSRHAIQHRHEAAPPTVRKRKIPTPIVALAGGLLVTAVLITLLTSSMGLHGKLAYILGIPILAGSTIFFYSILEEHK
jgi:hypothetical protein